MSFPSGHVPVGTGQQTPIGAYQNNHLPLQGQPARQVPSSVRGIVESRSHYPHQHRPVVVVTAQHQAERDVRQIPGTNSVVTTFRNTHQ